MPKPPARRKNEKTLRPVHPNAGIEAAYRKKLDALIKEMSDSVEYWIRAAYRKAPPRIAADESPASFLGRTIKQLAARWLKRFNEAAPKMADWFAQTTNKRSSDAMKKILKDAGISIEFKMTPAMRDILDATVKQNVALIKSIPQQYFGEIEGLVMRSVQRGGDLAQLTDDIQARYGVTRRRAKLIATTQNNLATASMTKAKQLEAGITEAIWMHSGGGREPRPTHLKAGRERTRFNIAEGWYDPAVGRHIQPGQEINCRCVSRPVIKGFS